MLQYLTDLGKEFGEGWNRFWFTPTGTSPVCGLRILTGLATLLYVLSYSIGLVRWFGPDGLLASEATRELINRPLLQWSLLYWMEQPALLWTFHVISCLTLTLFALGWQTRWTAPLSAFVVLNYIHRAPLLSSPAESILVLLLIYLCLSPCGRQCSLDARRGTNDKSKSPGDRLDWTANLTIRLIQVHLVGYYLLISLSMLGGSAWWDGQAVWNLMAQVHRRPLDLTFFRQWPYLIHLWTHLLVAFPLLFATLIWIPRGRPLLLVLSVFYWLSVIILTGQLLWGVVMVIAGLSFVSPANWTRMLRLERAPG